MDDASDSPEIFDNTPTSSGGGGSYLDTLNGLISTGARAYGAFNPQTPANPLSANTAARTTAAPVDWKKYLPWGIGAVVLLLVVGLIFRRK